MMRTRTQERDNYDKDTKAAMRTKATRDGKIIRPRTQERGDENEDT